MILLWQDNNEAAFTELYNRYVLKLLNIALHKTHSQDDAQELVQNTFLKFYQNKVAINPESPVFSYLYVVLKNQIITYHRSNLVRQKYQEYILATHSISNNTVETDLETKELEKEIEQAINLLPQKCKEVFILSRKKHLSNKEIASTLNISENTVEQHMRKALGRLRVSLKQHLVTGCIICILRAFL